MTVHCLFVPWLGLTVPRACLYISNPSEVQACPRFAQNLCFLLYHVQTLRIIDFSGLKRRAGSNELTLINGCNLSEEKYTLDRENKIES